METAHCAVLTVVLVRIQVFRYIMLCYCVSCSSHLKGLYCLRLQWRGVLSLPAPGAVGITILQPTQHHIPHNTNPQN